MTVAPDAASHADVIQLEHSLAADGHDVEVRETHCSTVFLVGDRAYKLRKPVRFDFCDQRSDAKRAELCRRDILLGESLAPGVVVSVRAVVPAADSAGYVLSDDDDPEAVDHVVEMRRFDEDDTMASRLQRGTLTTEQAHAAGGRIARFHRGAKRRRAGVDYREIVDRNFEGLLPLAEDLVPAGERLALQRFAAAFLLDWGGVLKARAAAGSVVDGHGDLRAEHVLFEGAEVLVVDRLEFEALRAVDVADELSFLLMELDEATGERILGDAVLAGYQSGGGDAQPEALLAFFGAYRALVRAKVALLRAEQANGAERAAARKDAKRLLALSCRLAWQARGPLLLLVTGPPATGKSSLARALGRVSGLPVLSSDDVRREHRCEPADYSSNGRAAVYADLARRADRERAVIVDATFGEEQLQRAFTEGLAEGGKAVSLVIECRAPTDVRVARAVERRARGNEASAAGPREVQRLGELFVSMHGAADDARLAVDTRAPLTAQVDEVSSWLDSVLASGRAA